MAQKKDAHLAVFGIFDTQNSLDRAVYKLKIAGFKNGDISVLIPDPEGSQNFVHERATKAPEGATTGATSGAILGGGLGWLVGIGALAIPGVGPFMAAGPIIAALAGAGVGGAVGGIAGAMIGFGIPEYEAKRYENLVKSGGFLLSVHVGDSEWAEKAKNILESSGAKDIASTHEAKEEIPSGLRITRDLNRDENSGFGSGSN
jgi:hypothetical protein